MFTGDVWESGCGLQAVLVVADADTSLTITGNGDVLEPYDGVIGERDKGLLLSASIIRDNKIFRFCQREW